MNAVTNNVTTAVNGLYFANPYDISKPGFYFNDMASLEKQLAHAGVEEIEVDYIDGELGELFRACGVDQCTIGLWLDQVLELHEHQQACLFYRCDDLSEDIETALANLDGTYISEGSAEDYARDLVDDCGMLDGMPEHLQCYFDYDAFARDMQLNGDVTEFTYGGTTYTATA